MPMFSQEGEIQAYQVEIVFDDFRTIVSGTSSLATISQNLRQVDERFALRVSPEGQGSDTSFGASNMDLPILVYI
jgi:hypothetical protein